MNKLLLGNKKSERRPFTLDFVGFGFSLDTSSYLPGLKFSVIYTSSSSASLILSCATLLSEHMRWKLLRGCKRLRRKLPCQAELDGMMG